MCCEVVGYLHCAGEETKAQRGKVIGPSFHSWSGAELGYILGGRRPSLNTTG